MPVRKRSGGFSLLNNIEKHKNVRDSDVTNLGLHNIEYNALRSLAKEKGWDINVRTGNQARVQYVGLKDIVQNRRGFIKKPIRKVTIKALFYIKNMNIKKD
ncbi:hypothetical protein RSE78_004012, partial [Yersinia enterocolitica]|nr:hypothetical protein [Yersinia enterocolitica]ELI7969569.1 hypothetical protein [Yersinia enterocolitica]